MVCELHLNKSSRDAIGGAAGIAPFEPVHKATKGIKSIKSNDRSHREHAIALWRARTQGRPRGCRSRCWWRSGALPGLQCIRLNDSTSRRVKQGYIGDGQTFKSGLILSTESTRDLSDLSTKHLCGAERVHWKEHQQHVCVCRYFLMCSAAAVAHVAVAFAAAPTNWVSRYQKFQVSR